MLIIKKGNIHWALTLWQIPFKALYVSFNLCYNALWQVLLLSSFLREETNNWWSWDQIQEAELQSQLPPLCIALAQEREFKEMIDIFPNFQWYQLAFFGSRKKLILATQGEESLLKVSVRSLQNPKEGWRSRPGFNWKQGRSRRSEVRTAEKSCHRWYGQDTPSMGIHRLQIFAALSHDLGLS